ncbi:hypothetical protein RHMOL_Rhmol07G0237100 [Rhododendron molle]|uniref:Uncharacterized protein n=1 Tax=Rhododendron molle TaxID=49168 RepID=A0ACC0N3Z7_RHOML|nr:hypothetical protein RHMOL_Rhmol07G0237100 [Rhododendron molle]
MIYCNRHLSSYSSVGRLHPTGTTHITVAHCPPLYFHHLRTRNEAIANLRHDGRSDGTTITMEMKREILEQWKNLSDEERHKFQKMAKEEHGKRKALVPRKPKKRKMQNQISLKSIVEIVKNFSEAQRAAVIEIGLGGILQLKCKFLNHRYVSGWYSTWIMSLQSLKLYLMFDMFPCCLGWVMLKLRAYCIDSMKLGVVVHFRSEEGRKADVKTSGNECGASHDSNGDVGGTNLTLEIVVGLLLRQNMLLERQLGYQMPSQVGCQMSCQLHQPAQQVDPEMPSQGVHTCETSTPSLFESPTVVDPIRKPLTPLRGVHTCETSTPSPFETPTVVDKPKGDEHMPSSSSDQCSMGQKTRKRKIQQVMDEVVISPSPLSGLKLRSGLSRGRKTKLPNVNCRRSLRLNKVEAHVEPSRLRQPYELKKSPYLCSSYTKDGRKQHKQAKMQSTINVDKHVHDMDVNVPAV